MKAVTPSVDMAFVLSDRCNLLFVDLAAGQTIGKLPIDGETFTAAAVSPDGRLLAAGTDYGSVYLVDPRSALIIGCLDDPVFFPAGPEARRGSVMTVDVLSAPCGGARPVGENVTCRCHCVAGQSLFELPGAICSCDVITTKTGRFGPTFSCECDLVDLRPPSCSCDSHATRRSSGKHYWRPN